MDTNIIRNIFIFISANIILVGLSLNFLEPYLPILMKHIFLYGKFGIKPPHVIATKLEVPKR